MLDEIDVSLLTPAGSACREAVPISTECLMISLVIFKFSNPGYPSLGNAWQYCTAKCLLINSLFKILSPFYLNISLLFLLVFILVFILITLAQYILH